MQNAVCLNLYCVFLMRSRPDWIRNIVHYSFFPLSLFLSLILPQRVLLLDKSDFCGTFFTFWRMFVKHELVVKDHETMHKCLGGGCGRWGFYGLLRRGWSIAGVFGIQCVFICFCFVLFFYYFLRRWRGWRGDSCRAPRLQLPSPDSDWPSATSPCCVFLKPMSVSLFSTVGF